jgi:hypothetical protein
MEFRDFLESDESDNPLLELNMKKLLASGLMGGIAAAGLMYGSSEKPAPPSVKPYEVPNENTRAMGERFKDKGTYYSTPTLKKLSRLAHKGDEWAMREIAWPEGHPFHKRGRPFFRNTGPHPDGLKFHSGFEGD